MKKMYWMFTALLFVFQANFVFAGMPDLNCHFLVVKVGVFLVHIKKILMVLVKRIDQIKRMNMP